MSVSVVMRGLVAPVLPWLSIPRCRGLSSSYGFLAIAKGSKALPHRRQVSVSG